jgi:phosphoribosyl 1,2-cyclic phosphodiesterase
VRILPLASGSQGNALLLEGGGRRILVDQGLEPDELELRLAAAGVDPARIDALLLTHRHKDHIRGAAAFSDRHGVPIFAPRATLRRLDNRLSRLVPITAGQTLTLGGVRVRPVLVCHDAPETVAYGFDDGRHRFGIATDLGCTDGRLREEFVGLDALLLEFNYDPVMLACGPYPRQLRDRVSGDSGHLSNDQAADFLAGIAHAGLRRLYVGHISSKNNHPDLAVEAAKRALCAVEGAAIEIVIATQDRPSPALEL